MDKNLQESPCIGPVDVNKQKIQNISYENSKKNILRKDQENQQCYGSQNFISKQSLLCNYMNFKRSNKPTRLMEWCGGAWVDFPGEVLSLGRSTFEKGVPLIEMKVGGNMYIFDFYRMLKVDVGNSGFQRSIAWIDLMGNCFFPKFFVDESLLDDDDDDEENENCKHSSKIIPKKIEIEMKNNKNNNKNNNDISTLENKNIEDIGISSKRKRKGKVDFDVEDICESSWNNRTKEGNKNQCFVYEEKVSWPNTRLMHEEERQFLCVKNSFLTGMTSNDPSVHVTKIHQFIRTGPIEKAMWEAFYKNPTITQAASGCERRSKIVYAWHGSSKKGIYDIVNHGFGVLSQVCGHEDHDSYVNISPISEPYESDKFALVDDNGEKHIILCRVNMGNYGKVDDESELLYPSSIVYNNGIDDQNKLYAMRKSNINTHIVPEFIVSYKSSEQRQGIKLGDKLMEHIPEGCNLGKFLFSNLANVLPTSKLEKVKVLCKAYEAGKIAKFLLIKRLRGIVGNDMINNIIAGV